MTGKRMLAFAMGLLLVVSLITVGYAQSPSDYCTEYGDLGISHDACVSCLNQGIGNDAACVCKIIGDTVGYAAYGFNNHGQCVKSLVPFIHPN